MNKIKTIQELEIKLFLQPLHDLIAKLSYVRRLERAWRLVEKDYADPSLTLEKAATTSGASKNHLNILFRRKTTFTFHQFLIRYRLLKAITMMISKDFSFLEITMENGFGSLNTFERNFHRIMGSYTERI